MTDPRPAPSSVAPSAFFGPSVNPLLTADDLAARWQVPTSQVYRLTREGQLPAVRLGRYYRYSLTAIHDFEQSGGTTADV